MATAPPQPKPVGKFLTQPLVNDLYTADPSAHVFNGRIFIYPSHDIDAGVSPTIWAATSRCATITCSRWTASRADPGRWTTTASRWISRTCHGPAVRCGRPTRRKRAAATTCISRRRTNRTSSASASPSAPRPQGPFTAQPGRSTAPTASIPACSRTPTVSHYMYSAVSGAGNSSAGRAGSYIRHGHLPGERAAGDQRQEWRGSAPT